MMENLGFIAYAAAKEKKKADRESGSVYAARLLGAVNALRLSIDRPMSFMDKPVYDKKVTEIREVMGEEAFQVAWDEGNRLNLEQAVELATAEFVLGMKN
jgi:hypothetical protein